MNCIKKAFTLVELTITMIILSLLVGIIFQVFIVISHMAVKVQNEKLLHNELIYVMQTIQNIVDSWDMELYWYSDEAWSVKETLNLSWSTKKYTIELNNDILELISYDALGFTTTYALTDSSKITVKQFYVKVFPHQEGVGIEQIVHDGFWLFLDVETPRYDATKRRYRVKRKMQTFFNIRKYD